MWHLALILCFILCQGQIPGLCFPWQLLPLAESVYSQSCVPSVDDAGTLTKERFWQEKFFNIWNIIMKHNIVLYRSVQSYSMHSLPWCQSAGAEGETTSLKVRKQTKNAEITRNKLPIGLFLDSSVKLLKTEKVHRDFWCQISALHFMWSFTPVQSKCLVAFDSWFSNVWHLYYNVEMTLQCAKQWKKLWFFSLLFLYSWTLKFHSKGKKI